MPSNLPGDVCTASEVRDVTFTGDREIDTDRDCDRIFVQPDGAPIICLVSYGSVTIARGATLRVKGSRVLALVAAADVLIQGTLDASAHGPSGGPGAVSTGFGSAALPMTIANGIVQADAAGGGGGYGDPRKRPAEIVAQEVRNGVISADAARELYGAKVDESR